MCDAWHGEMRNIGTVRCICCHVGGSVLDEDRQNNMEDLS
jgi:hypothetical protein